jgi:hydroxybutyrate-dimer hydrolase
MKAPDFILGKIVVTDYGKQRPCHRSEAVAYNLAPEDDDLQSAGLSQDELGKPTYPFLNAEAPTPVELRRLAIFTNYAGLMERDPEGGYGIFFGPKRKVYGREYMALARVAPDLVATLMVQIPDSFDTRTPFIVTAPSSASRGVYGAISLAEWAFENRCAIAYTDKGTGPAVHDLSSDTCYGMEGYPVHGDDTPLFRVPDSTDLESYKKKLPNRLALKHAHSEANVEKHWGQCVLISIEFALYCLTDYFGEEAREFTRANTKVIAAGVSNGGGAALRAAEQDDPARPLIDAVVVSEPQVQPQKSGGFAIRYRGNVLRDHSRSFFDTVTLMNLYAPCAALLLDERNAPNSPIQQIRAQRCALLHSRGLLTVTGVREQAQEALQIIHDHGFLAEADFILPWHEEHGLWRVLTAAYANAYGRANVTDHLCSCSFAAIDRSGQPKAPSPALASQLFGWSNGLTFISPHGITDVIDDQPMPDFNLGPALCFRSLATGVSYPGQILAGAQWIDTPRIEAGISEVRATGDLQGKPALILHGRSDALIPPNHSSRAYFGLNKIVEGAASRLSYIEIVNANHFDGFISMFGKKRLVPMHYYLDQALSKMRSHLLDPVKHRLPGSQVVAARADNKPWNRGDDAYKNDLPDIALEPVAAQRIEFRDATVEIPDGC